MNNNAQQILETVDLNSVNDSQPSIVGCFKNTSYDRFTKVTTINPGGIFLERTLRDYTPECDVSYKRPKIELDIYVRRSETENQLYISVSFINESKPRSTLDTNLIFILDDSKNINLSQSTDQKFESKTIYMGTKYTTTEEFPLEENDLFAIVSAQKIEFSLRLEGVGQLDGILEGKEVMVLCGFYNNVFDNNFGVSKISKLYNDIAQELERKELDKIEILELEKKNNKLIDFQEPVGISGIIAATVGLTLIYFYFPF